MNAECRTKTNANFRIVLHSAFIVLHLAVTNFLHSSHDPVNAGHHRFFEEMIERHGDLVAVNVFDRGIEIIERGLLDLVQNARSPCRSSPSLRR